MTLPGRHAEPQELVAYRSGEMTGEERERLQDHLALCAECSEMLLDLIHFDELEMPEGVPEPTDAEVEAALERLQARLAEAEAPSEALPAPFPFPARGDRASRGPAWWVLLPWALAASLAAVALTLWQRPSSGPVLVSSQTTRSGGTAQQAVLVGIGVGQVNPGIPPPFEAVVLIRDAKGKERWRSKPFIYQGDNIELAIPRRAFRAGTYFIQLVELDGDREKPASDEVGFQLVR